VREGGEGGERERGSSGEKEELEKKKADRERGPRREKSCGRGKGGSQRVRVLRPTTLQPPDDTSTGSAGSARRFKRLCW